MKKQLAQIGRKVRRQIGKDYIFFPALTGPAFLQTAAANGLANLTRNLWSYMIIFCGHFPDGALHFTEEELEDETRAEWYLRQMLGLGELHRQPASCTSCRATSASRSSTTCSRTCRATATRRSARRSGRCADKYGIPYTTGPLYKQYGQALRTITKLSLPNRFTKPARHDYPETPEVPRGRRSDDERPIRASPRPGRGPPRRRRDRPTCRRTGHAPTATCRSPAWATSGSTSARSTQCALSRICGVCAGSLARPVAFLGTPEEAARNEFHFPPTHVGCAEVALEVWGATSSRARPSDRAGVLGAGDHLGVRVRPAHPRVGGPASGVLAELVDRPAPGRLTQPRTSRTGSSRSPKTAAWRWKPSRLGRRRQPHGGEAPDERR